MLSLSTVRIPRTTSQVRSLFVYTCAGVAQIFNKHTIIFLIFHSSNCYGVQHHLWKSNKSIKCLWIRLILWLRYLVLFLDRAAGLQLVVNRAVMGSLEKGCCWGFWTEHWQRRSLFNKCSLSEPVSWTHLERISVCQWLQAEPLPNILACTPGFSTSIQTRGGFLKGSCNGTANRANQQVPVGLLPYPRSCGLGVHPMMHWGHFCDPWRRDVTVNDSSKDPWH